MADEDLDLCVIAAESREEGTIRTYLCHLDTDEVEELYASPYGGYPAAHNKDFSKLVLVEGYMVGDNVAYLWEKGKGAKLLYGKPLADRQPGEEVPLTAFGSGFFTEDGHGLVFNNALFKDTYGLGVLPLDNPEAVSEVTFAGLVHTGAGEFDGLAPLKNGRFLLFFNIDGASWVYEAEYDADAKVMRALYVLVGRGVLADGVLEALTYDHETDSFAIAFSTATSPQAARVMKSWNSSVNGFLLALARSTQALPSTLRRCAMPFS